MTPSLETARLRLRPLTIDDAEPVQILFPQWEIVRYLNSRVPWPYPADGARRFYSDIALPAIARGDAWHWSLRLKSDSDRLIGTINLMKSENDNRGFWLGLPWQGRGLATEAADAVTDFWFDALAFDVLRVSKAVPNRASRRISEKQKMRLVASGERDYVSGRLPAEFWEVGADEWRQRTLSERSRETE